MILAKRKDELVFLPLGGVGEIGMNLGLYGIGPEFERNWLMVDCGLTFGGPDTPGVDLIFPDVKFIEDDRANLAGIIITHAHEDHYGALTELWPRLRAPVYMTPFAHGLLMAKYGGNQPDEHIPVTIVRAGDRHKIGPFDVEFVGMSHSLPEPMGLMLRTDQSNVFHSADWKLDPTPGFDVATDLDQLKALGDEGIHALVSDSTSVVTPGVSPSEADVSASLKEIISEAPHRVIVTTFASHVGRIKAVIEAAADTGREVIAVGRSMERILSVARELGMLEGLPPIRDQEMFQSLPRSKVVLICTGSQGESRAALARIAADEHRHISFAAGDRVIFSSRTIPGNERQVSHVINNLSDRNVEIITDRDALVHASGHPRRDEVRQLYKALRPDVALPVHGEPLHLAVHGRLASEMGVRQALSARNGQIVRLAPDPAGVIDEVYAGRLHLDGRLLVDPLESGLQERKKVAYAGHIAVAIVIDKKGNLLGEPQIALTGLPDTDAVGEPFHEIVLDAVVGAIESIPRQRRKDAELVRESARRAARAETNQRWGKKPLCRVLVSVL